MGSTLKIQDRGVIVVAQENIRCLVVIDFVCPKRDVEFE